MNKFSIKMSKVMLALATLFADEKDSVIKSDIFIFIINIKAVRDSI